LAFQALALFLPEKLDNFSGEAQGIL
jgi:hypothetical protein